MAFGLIKRLSGSYTTVESRARKATNDDVIGPSTEDLQQLTRLSFKPKACSRILFVLESRLQQSDRHWRQKSKTLTVMQYFIIHGSPQCLEWLRTQDSVLKKLEKTEFLDSHKKDLGKSVRDKAKSLREVVQDPEKIEEAKEAYKRQREGFRKSINTGRPSTQSRNTLEMLRENIFDDPDPDDINRVFQSALVSESSSNVPPRSGSPSDTDAIRNHGGLSAIEEEE